MSKRVLVCTAWLLLAFFPVQMVAGDAVGVLTNTGTVLVDSRQSAFGNAVFAGELIETKAKSKAVITGKGRILSLGENSTMRLGAKDLQLNSGSVVITANFSFATEIGGARVVTDPAIPTKFLASRVGDGLKIVTLEGLVYVNDGQQTTPVPATKGLDIHLGGSKNSNNYPGARTTSWLSNDDIGILIVVAAGIAAGVTLGVVNALNAHPATPAGP